MPTRNVVLTDHQEHLIASLVTSGRYQSASEILREGLRLIEVREKRDAAKLVALQDAAHLGFNDLEEGRYRDVTDDALDDYLAELGTRARESLRGA
jgi:antitoxin ParD1/3/4